jgi:hypothetical protein
MAEDEVLSALDFGFCAMPEKANSTRANSAMIFLMRFSV